MISPNAGLRTEKDNTKAVQKMGLAEECPEPMGNSGAATGAAVREQSDDDTVRKFQLSTAALAQCQSIFQSVCLKGTLHSSESSDCRLEA